MPSMMMTTAVNVVSIAVGDPRMNRGGAKRLSDITCWGGLASLTGIERWQLALILFPILQEFDQHVAKCQSSSRWDAMGYRPILLSAMEAGFVCC